MHDEADFPDRTGIPFVQMSLPISLLNVISTQDRASVASMLATACVVPQALKTEEYERRLSFWDACRLLRNYPPRPQDELHAYSGLVKETFKSMLGAGPEYDESVGRLVRRMRDKGVICRVDHIQEKKEEESLFWTDVAVTGLSSGSPYQGKIIWKQDVESKEDWSWMTRGRDAPPRGSYRLAKLP